MVRKKSSKYAGPAIYPYPDPNIVSLVDLSTGERVDLDLRNGPVVFDDGEVVGDTPEEVAPEDLAVPITDA